MLGVFTKNTIITFLSRTLALFMSLLVSIILARSLGPEGRGIYALVILLPGILLIFFDFGITPATAFYIGKKKYPLSQIFGNNIFLSIFFSSLAMFAGVLIIFLLRKHFFSGVPTNYLLFGILYLPLSIFFYSVSAILLGVQKIKMYNLAFLLGGVFSLLLVVILVSIFKLGVLGAILAFIFSSLAPVIFLFITVRNLTKEISLRLNKNYLKDVLSFGTKFHFSNIFAFLHSHINILLINFYINPVAVGFFSIANSLVTQIQSLAQSATVVLLPKIAAEEEEKKKKEFTPLVCRNIILITFLGALFFFFLAKWLIVLFYSKEFLSSVLPFRILLPAIVAFAGSQILAVDFIGRGKPMLNTYVNGGTLLLSIILSIILIPKFGIEGAAWALTVSYIAMFISKLIIYSKISKNRIKDVILFSSQDIEFYKNLIISYRIRLKNMKSNT